MARIRLILALAALPGVRDVADQRVAIAFGERHAPCGLAHGRPGGGDVGGKDVIRGEQPGHLMAQRGDDAAGECRQIDDGLGTDGADAPGDAVGKDDAPFGIGVDDLDRGAALQRQDVAGAIAAGADGVLDQRKDCRRGRGGPAEREGQDGAGARCGTGHVGAHLPHGGSRLDADPAGVERDALADEQDGRSLGRSAGRGRAAGGRHCAGPAQDDEARRVGACGPDRKQPGEPFGSEPLGAQHLDLDPMPGKRLEAFGEDGGCQDVAGFGHEVAGEQGGVDGGADPRPGDAGGLGILDDDVDGGQDRRLGIGMGIRPGAVAIEPPGPQDGPGRKAGSLCRGPEAGVDGDVRHGQQAGRQKGAGRLEVRPGADEKKPAFACEDLGHLARSRGEAGARRLVGPGRRAAHRDGHGAHGGRTLADEARGHRAGRRVGPVPPPLPSPARGRG